MKLPRSDLIGLIIAFTMIIFLSLLIGEGEKTATGAQFDPSGRTTTYSTSPSGYKAIYDIGLELGLDVERWTRPFYRLGEMPAKKTTLVVAEPWGGVSPTEMDALLTWLNEGGQLILLASNQWYMRTNTKLEEIIMANEQEAEKKQMPSVQSEFGVKLHAFPAGDSQVGDAPKVATRKTSGDLHWAGYVSGNLKALVKHKGRIHAGAYQLGQGRIVFVADGKFLSTDRLRKSRNSVWFYRLANKWGPRIFFDEYHHGNAEKQGFFEMIGSFVSTRWGLGFIQAGLALLLFLYFHRRFKGNPMVAEAGSHQDTEVPLSGLLPVRARLLAKAGATNFAVQAVFKSFHYVHHNDYRLVLPGAQQKFESARSLGGDEIQLILRYLSGADAEQYMNLLDSARSGAGVTKEQLVWFCQATRFMEARSSGFTEEMHGEKNQREPSPK